MKPRMRTAGPDRWWVFYADDFAPDARYYTDSAHCHTHWGLIVRTLNAARKAKRG